VPAGCIAPVLGIESTLTDGHSIVLLAPEPARLTNLCRLVTRLQAAPDREAALARGLFDGPCPAHGWVDRPLGRRQRPARRVFARKRHCAS
jgi:hypothetical protein